MIDPNTQFGKLKKHTGTALPPKIMVKNVKNSEAITYLLRIYYQSLLLFLTRKIPQTFKIVLIS